MKKTFLNIPFALCMLISMLGMQQLWAQHPCKRSVSEQMPGNVSATNRTIALPIGFTLNKNVQAAVVKYSADLGEDYIFGRFTNDFQVEINFQLEALDISDDPVGGVFNTSSYTIFLDNAHPEASFVKDFSSFAETNGTFDFAKFRATLTANVNVTGSAASSVKTQIANKLRMFLSYEINYGFDLSMATAPDTQAMASQDVSGTREVIFEWDADHQEFCNYQFQLLRLHNTSDATASDEKIITATVDWAEALTLQTESYQTALKLTVAEGQGYYLWRVRPVSNYYPGGIANPLNLNDNLWSAAPASGAVLSLTTASFTTYPTLFFLTDPDDHINRIYSRTFTEGNKISETSTYANSLQQVKQTQSYLPSKDTTLVVQHVLDMSGRPALTTLPAPVDSSMYQGYKPGLFRNESGQLYTGRDYDQPTNFDDPNRAGQTSGAFRYYSDNNTENPNVPDAQGYPFQRTQYYNDGTDRVKQQSGVGKQQMIGSGNPANADGEGKTVKTYYGTPSEMELIRLFGDEAPSSENVFKTINIDQNNTATITLTDKEGKVIATSLSFQDEDNDGIFEPLSGEGTPETLIEVSDTITRNTKTDNGFVSSKRLAILQTTPMNIGYRIACDTLGIPCANAEVDCGYHLKIQLFNLDNNTVDVLYDSLLKDIACEAVEGKEGLYKTVELEPLMLTPGNYIIQKNLTVGTVTALVTAAMDKVEIQTAPISGLIKGWLEDVKCPPQLVAFFGKLDTLATNINSGNPGNLSEYNFPEDFMTLYGDGGFAMSISPSAENPQLVVLSTPCCANLRIPVDWVPPFNCPAIPQLVDKNNNGILDVRDYNPYASPGSELDSTEFFPDFEGYARVFLRECWDSTEFYGTYMEGWLPGQFNLMVYHMLTDQYNCTNNFPFQTRDTSDTRKQIDSLLDNRSTIYDACGDSIGYYHTGGLSFGCGDSLTVPIYGVPTQVSACPQYTCDQLFGCWATQLAAYRAKKCFSISIDIDGNNVANKADQQPGLDREPGASGAPDDFDDNFDSNVKGGGFLGKWITKKAVSSRMRNLQGGGANATIQPEYEQHLVKDFLQCTGYRFAKVLTQYDPYPLPADSAGGIDYTVAAVNSLVDIDDAKKTNGDYYYMPFSDWKPGKTDFTASPSASVRNSNAYKGHFPFITNPIFAFKYFEYPFESDTLYQDIEAMTCYSDPNECYLTFDGVNPPVRIPCCATIDPMDGSYDLSKCYKDYEYPNIENLPLDTNFAKPTYGILEDGGGRYKLVIENFCDAGRYTCEYTKDVWSCGQRAAFYLALRSYQHPDENYLSVYPERDCEFVAEVQDWYTNPFADDNGFPDIISGSEVDVLVDAHPLQYGPGSFPALTGLKDLNGDPVSVISLVEMEMVKMNTECLSKCSNRRSEIIRILTDLLTRKCYIIGPCKTDDDYVLDNVIPQEDFNAMVDAIIAQCQSQCGVDSYKCFPPEYCRMFKTYKTELGYNRETVGVNYGVGREGGDACTLVTGTAYYNCSGAADSTLSYCQYTKYKQAIGWNIELDIPSACPGNQYSKVFDCDEENTTCVPKDSYEKTGTPLSGPNPVISGAIPVNVTVDD